MRCTAWTGEWPNLKEVAQTTNFCGKPKSASEIEWIPKVRIHIKAAKHVNNIQNEKSIFNIKNLIAKKVRLEVIQKNMENAIGIPFVTWGIPCHLLAERKPIIFRNGVAVIETSFREIGHLYILRSWPSVLAGSFLLVKASNTPNTLLLARSVGSQGSTFAKCI